jgi:hypothetical protein
MQNEEMSEKSSNLLYQLSLLPDDRGKTIYEMLVNKAKTVPRNGKKRK